jgi:hypothetical protein
MAAGEISTGVHGRVERLYGDVRAAPAMQANKQRRWRCGHDREAAAAMVIRGLGSGGNSGAGSERPRLVTFLGLAANEEAHVYRVGGAGEREAGGQRWRRAGGKSGPEDRREAAPARVAGKHESMG